MVQKVMGNWVLVKYAKSDVMRTAPYYVKFTVKFMQFCPRYSRRGKGFSRGKCLSNLSISSVVHSTKRSRLTGMCATTSKSDVIEGC